MHKRPRHLRHGTLAAAVILALGPATAGASAFQLLEQSAQGQGTSFAGTATKWRDPATAFWNPAGMARHSESSFTAVGSAIDIEFDFTDDGSSLAGTGGAPFNAVPGASGEEQSDGGETAVVPAFYYINPINDRWTFGFAVNTPFGLESNFDDEWVGRYHATDSELITLNLNPSFAYRLNDRVSVGFGINVQYADATLENRIDPTAAGAAFFGGNTFGSGRGDPDDDTDAEVEGDSWGAHINFGFLADLTERTTLGLAFRGHITHSVDGNADFDHRNTAFATASQSADVFTDSGVDATLDLPETLTLSLSRDSARFDNVTFMGDLTMTRWSRLQAIEIEFDSNQPDSVEELGFDDTLRIAVGATWDVTPEWQLRTGVAFDESPVDDPAVRTPRIPDNDRRWFSVGVGYQPAGGDFTVDAGFTHIDIDDTAIDRTNAFGDQLTGEFESSVNILAVQGSWRF